MNKHGVVTSPRSTRNRSIRKTTSNGIQKSNVSRQGNKSYREAPTFMSGSSHDLNKVIDKWTDNKETVCYTWDLED